VSKDTKATLSPPPITVVGVGLILLPCAVLIFTSIKDFVAFYIYKTTMPADTGPACIMIFTMIFTFSVYLLGIIFCRVTITDECIELRSIFRRRVLRISEITSVSAAYFGSSAPSYYKIHSKSGTMRLNTWSFDRQRLTQIERALFEGSQFLRTHALRTL
jgi:hypothetical protein